MAAKSETKKAAEPEVVSISVTRSPRDLSELKRHAAILRPEQLALAKYGVLPLAMTTMRIELAGVPTAVASALRRVVIDELYTARLVAERAPSQCGTTDVHLPDDFIQQRIHNIPLRYAVPDVVVRKLRLAVEVKNETDKPRTVFTGDLRVTAGEMPRPALFNPSFELATIQPGTTFRVEGICLVRAPGRLDGVHQAAPRAVTRPLDVERLPREKTHLAGAPAADDSGYPSAGLTNPRRHEVIFTLAAAADVGEAHAVALDACREVAARLAYVRSVLQRDRAAQDDARASYTETELGDGKSRGELSITDETDTIGALLQRYAYDMARPADDIFVTYANLRHEQRITLTLRMASDPRAHLDAAAARAIEVFDTLRRGIETKRTARA